MKFKFFLLLCILIVCKVELYAQPGSNIPVIVNPITSIPDALPQDFDPNALDGKRNFVRTYSMKYPETDESLIQSNISLNNAIMSTNYFDGLGRPLQTVVKRGINNLKDLVETKVYDNLGRETYQYLPYGSSLTNGKFKPNAFSEQDSYYNTTFFTGGSYVNEKVRYTKTEFDNSPLKRPLFIFAPGNAWGGSSVGVSKEYESNSVGEVQLWEVINNSPNTSVSSTYQSEELYKNKVKDEDNNVSVEYTDKNGKLILKTQQIDWVTQGNMLSPVYNYTYYVYDELERLRFVIPPLAVEKLKGQLGWVMNQTLLDELCFQYVYDAKGRIIEKKVPGKAWEYLIYDKKDRIILTQDGNLNADSKWQFSIYDQLGRIKVTGIYTNISTRQVLQNLINTTIITTTPGNVLLDWVCNYNTGNYDYPVLNDADIQTYTYYDRYPAWVTNTFDQTQVLGLPTGMPNAEATVVSNMTHGQVTATKIKVLKPVGSTLSDWLNSVNFYDSKGRLIQNQQTNSVGGMEINTMLYDFSNKVLATYSHHTNPSANLPLQGSPMYNSTNILKKHTYDAQNRLTSMYSNINNLGDMMLVSNSYDNLGRLSIKSLGQGAETQYYSYNIRGWLTAINADWVNTPNPVGTHYFGEVLSYEQGFASQNLNGNITGIKWRGADKTVGQRAYGYTYDKLNRLTHAEFRTNKIVSGAWDNIWAKTDLDFTNSNITYDANGNILTMNQRGPGTTGPENMDVMNYEYETISGISTNKLKKVTDIGNASNNGANHDFKDGANGGDDYEYDANGNLIVDENKEISSITYSELNKPKVIIFANGNSIEYVYDAIGSKLQKIVIDLAISTTTVTDYVNGHIYKTTIANGISSTSLEYILHEEGRIRPYTDGNNQQKYTYDFFVKDHLGNIRSTINAIECYGPPQAITYQATLEPVMLPQENILFDDLDNVLAIRPASNDPNNIRAIVLDGDDPTRRVGTSLLLRVMPGDKFSIKTQAYYNTATVNDPIDPNELIQSLINNLNTSNTGNPVGEFAAEDVIAQTIGTPSFIDAWNTFKSNQVDSNKPMGFVNYLFFDDQFNFVQDMSGSMQVNTANAWHELYTGVTPIEISQPGYLFAFHSIENLNKVYFDNFDMAFYKGALMEETHYYPFGLTMGMPMSYGGVGVDQKYKFNGKELQRDEFGTSGLEWYDFGARLQDPQIGRWGGGDPKADQRISLTPYNAMSNNPINRIDPDGALDSDVDDIIFKGTDNKEVRVIAPGEDHAVNVPTELKENKTIDLGLGLVNVHKFVYGYTVQGDFQMGLVGAGQWGAEITVAKFTNPLYANYNYVYTGGHINASAGAQLSFSLSAGASLFVGYNTDSKYDPSTFAGKTYSVSWGQDLKEVVGGGYNVSAFSSTPNISGKGWKGLSLGVNVGVGGAVNLGAIGTQISNTVLLNDVVPTSKRGYIDRISNRLSPFNSVIVNYGLRSFFK